MPVVDRGSRVEDRSSSHASPLVFECAGLDAECACQDAKSRAAPHHASSRAILPVGAARRLARALLALSRMRWRHELEPALLMGVLALAACGGVKESAGADGSPGSESDAGDEPGDDDAQPEPVPDAAPPGACQDAVTPLLANGGFEEAEPRRSTCSAAPRAVVAGLVDRRRG